MDTDHRRWGPRPPILDMTPEGEFRDPAPPPRRTWLDRALARIGGFALLLAMAAGGVVVVIFSIMLLGLLLPVVIGAGLVAFGTLWWRARRLRRGLGGGLEVNRRRPGGLRFVVIRR